MLEERVEHALDHHVEVDEERRANQVEEGLAERGDLAPAALGAVLEPDFIRITFAIVRRM